MRFEVGPNTETIARRQWLRNAAVGALGTLAWVSPSRAAESDPPRRIRKAVKYHMIQEELPVLDKFKLLADLGFDGTEIHVTTKIDREEVRKQSMPGCASSRLSEQ